ncbi:MAG: hypothetical protein Q7S92_07290 [Candidatus Diapherotrites archaeon]|nr:hypothetical protein [Candidatus Diapherotrites archaeon]
MNCEIIPAVLSQTSRDLNQKISLVKNYVKTIQLDVMDNDFVPNQTVGLDSFSDLPSDIQFEFHWMVHHPERWIAKLQKPFFHWVHVESKIDWPKLKKAVESTQGLLGIALNPDTSVQDLGEHAFFASGFLVMTVHPGFSGQLYLPKVEEKISILRKKFPETDIEVDGGINLQTIARAQKAGANKFVCGSSIFSNSNPAQAIQELSLIVNQGMK